MNRKNGNLVVYALKIRTMKTIRLIIVIINIAAIGYFALLTRNFLFTAMAFLFMLIPSFLMHYRALRYFHLKKLRDRINHIFVISNHQYDNEKKVILAGLQRFIINVPYNSVLMEKARIEKDLEESGNNFWKEKGNRKLKVIPIIYQDGVNVCEDWMEFHERCKGIIQNELSEWHKTLKQTKPIWYDKFANLQLGIEYEL